MKKTPLYTAHENAGGKIVEFAGYAMPVQYADGVLKEHLWTRSNGGLFDVSHMGQAFVEGEGAGEYLSKITPSSFAKTPFGKAKYTVLTNENGGIIDDLIITKISDTKFFIVFNAGCKDKDIAWFKKHLPTNITFTELSDRALIALQGVKAESTLSALVNEDVASQGYMTYQVCSLKNGGEIFVSRLGYTGEDGYEISVPANNAEKLWNAILENLDVKPIGLGARDSLRLEMGYPLYGHDLNDEISPIEAGLAWVCAKSNTTFIGAERILRERENGTSKKRIGIKLLDKGVVREGATIQNEVGDKIGIVTSGGFGPSFGGAIGQGYVEIAYVPVGTKIKIEQRGRILNAEVCSFTFVKAKTKS